MQEYQWDDKSMSLEVLLQTEKQTTSNTLNVRGEDSVEINNLINIFFRLSYHCWENMQSDSTGVTATINPARIKKTPKPATIPNRFIISGILLPSLSHFWIRELKSCVSTQMQIG